MTNSTISSKTTEQIKGEISFIMNEVLNGGPNDELIDRILDAYNNRKKELEKRGEKLE